MPSTCSKTAASILGCTEKQLRDFVNHPTNLDKLLNELKGKKVRTTYADRNGFHKTFYIDGITSEGADSLMAYGKLARPFNVCVAAHYYAHHRIRLCYPYSPCIVEKFNAGGENHFYPLELVELIDYPKPTLHYPKRPTAAQLEKHGLSYDPLHHFAVCKGKTCNGHWLPCEELPSPPSTPSTLEDSELDLDFSKCNLGEEPPSPVKSFEYVNGVKVDSSLLWFPGKDKTPDPLHIPEKSAEFYANRAKVIEKMASSRYWYLPEKTPSPPDTPSTLDDDEFDFDRAMCSQPPMPVSPTPPLVTRAPE